MVKKNNRNNNEVLVQGTESVINQIKYEIAKEFGVQLGADTTSRANGSVGGEITISSSLYSFVCI
ncbi:small, acid-soluble spore protein, alpha/beta type [Bacillus sp. 22475]|uniref:small, acid-soluble spore protein, alpha/beta type n=1 Tax=Bacillus sp. 22475 TaxID=3453925 RepID=UPI003F8525BE